MIRITMVVIVLFGFLILGIPLLVAEWLIGLKNPDLKSRSSLAIVNWVFRLIIRITGAKVTVIGEERVPRDTAVLYVGNHRSYFDVLLTYVRVPRPTGYIAKKEMLRYPLLRDWMRNLHCLFLDRDNIKEGLKTILTAVEKVQNGISITIFPEGTRNRVPDTILPFHDGSFKIAEKGNVPIVPISLVNTAAIFEDHLPKIKKANVIIEYCEPIYLNDLDKTARKGIGDHVSSIIMETYQKNRKLLDEQSDTPAQGAGDYT